MDSRQRRKIHSVPWGIPRFDELTGGIPANDLSIIETPNYHSGMIALGHFLFHGLQQGQKCALVTFDSPTVFLDNFLSWKMDFEKYLDSEQFALLHYKPNVTAEVGMTYSYDVVFEEIQRLCGGRAPERLAIHQVDVLISLNNLVLMNSCCQKLTAAAHSEAMSRTSVLGQFVQFSDQVHRDLSIACQKTMAGYFELTVDSSRGPESYGFSTKKLPWFGYSTGRLPLVLQEGVGFLGNDSNESEAA